MAITHVTTKDEFNTEVVEVKDKLVVVDFWAPWCGPCKMLGPVFEALAEEKTDIKFVKINVDEATDVAEKFEIMSIPTLMIVKDGTVVDQKAGALDKEALIAFIESKQ